MPTFLVRSKIKPYKVHIKIGALADFGEALAEIGITNLDWNNIVFVCDKNTESLAVKLAENINRLNPRAAEQEIHSQRIISIAAGEVSKSLVQAEFLWQKLATYGLGRQLILAAVGGGVVGDLTGFVAGTFLRGVRLIHVPTTLISQVDSSLGGKVGINLDQGKNLIGLFYPAFGVIVDPESLRSLPEIELQSGLVEVVKIGALFDPALYHEVSGAILQDCSLLTPVISRAIELKVKIIEQDEFETTDKRIFLNLGHTIGHALEAGCDFRGITHGQAVALGMVLEHRFLNLEKSASELEDKLRASSLIGSLPKHFDLDRATNAIFADKKGIQDEVLLPYIEEIGRPSLTKVKTRKIADFIKIAGLLS